MSSEATRFSLLKSMRRLVGEKPFQKISVDEICERAHVSRRTFYRYFPDKYELLASVYKEYYLPKLNIQESDSFWDILAQIIRQMYEYQDFFIHAFDVKGQNGFWEELQSYILPFILRELPTNEFTEEKATFFVTGDIYGAFQMIEQWMQNGFPEDPDSFYRSLRQFLAMHGRWLYQFALGEEPEVYTPETAPTWDE